MIAVVFTLLLLPLTLGIAVYLGVLALASWRYRPRQHSSGQLTWGVIVPAHDEEQVIAETVQHVRHTAYPGQKIRVMVIADNCSDRTSAVAKMAGAEVFERSDIHRRGKGHALDWFLTQHVAAYCELDALCIVDADSAMDPQFFNEMNCALSDPQVQVVQGSNRVSNPLENWRTALVHAAFCVFNHLRMAGTQKLFRTSTLKGNGMAFRTVILADLKWPAYSCIEDLEYTMVLADRAIRVSYQSTAVISSAMIASARQAGVQRRRWEAGRLLFSYRNLGRAIRRGHWALVCDLLTPPLSLYALLVCLGSLLSVASPGLLATYMGIWLGLCFVVVSAQIQCRSPLKVWLYLMASPVFIAWKGMIYAKWLMFGCSQSWAKSVRGGQV